jgi:hypothetical protein
MSLTDSRGKLLEQTVALLERGIAPEARIEIDVWLPELATGTDRQCDVVIRQGVPPREKLTIVEVQDRNSKVDINTFQGWCAKRDALGANELICVSVAGFPSSIDKSASQQGGRVRLMTLVTGKEKPDFIKNAGFYWDMDVLEFYDVAVEFNRQQPPANLTTDTCAWRIDSCAVPVSLTQIIELRKKNNELTSLTRTELGDGRYSLNYRLFFKPPLVLFDGSSSTESVVVTEQHKRAAITLKADVRAYEQTNFKGALAWVVYADAEYEGGTVFIRMIAVPSGPGVRIVHADIPRKLPGMTVLPGPMYWVLANPKKD